MSSDSASGLNIREGLVSFVRDKVNNVGQEIVSRLDLAKLQREPKESGPVLNNPAINARKDEAREELQTLSRAITSPQAEFRFAETQYGPYTFVIDPDLDQTGLIDENEKLERESAQKIPRDKVARNVKLKKLKDKAGLIGNMAANGDPNTFRFITSDLGAEHMFEPEAVSS